MNGLIDVLLTESNMNQINNMIRKIRNQYLNSLIQKYLGRTNQYKQSLGNEKPARKGLKGVWKMRILNFALSQDEFHANGREHSFGRCAQISFVFKLFVASRDLQDIWPYLTQLFKHISPPSPPQTGVPPVLLRWPRLLARVPAHAKWPGFRCLREMLGGWAPRYRKWIG